MKLKVAKPYYNIDPVSKSIVGDALFDGYRNEADAFCSRFGLTEFVDLGTKKPGDGLFWWDKTGMVLAVSGGRAFSISQNGTITELPGGDFTEGTTAIFSDGQKVDNSAFLYVCNGGKLNYSTGGNFTQAPSPAPQRSTHVVYNGLRFLANEAGTARFSFTDVNPSTGEFDPTYWDAIENPLTSDARGDNVSGIFQAWDDIAVWGSEGREIWQTTGTEPPLQSRLGSFCEAGLIAPYSVKKADNTFFALCSIDGKPAVVRLAGNDPLIISLDIEKVLDGFSVVSDAIGDIVSAGGQSFYILTFPTEGQTWVYNIKKTEWYCWSRWNDFDSDRETFIGRHFIWAKAWGKHLCMSRIDGKIFEVDVDATSDDGDTIRSEYQSGNLDGGTSKRKTLPMLRIMCRRAQGTISGNEPVIIFRYRDNGSQEWKNERQVSLGKQGQYEFYRTLHNLGMFRSRQFSIILTDAAKLEFVEMDLEMKRLES